MTGEVQQQQRWAAIVRHEPEAAYQAHVARCRANGKPLAYPTAADFVEAWRVAAEWLPYLRVQHVLLTKRGRKAVHDLAASTG